MLIKYELICRECFNDSCQSMFKFLKILETFDFPTILKLFITYNCNIHFLHNIIKSSSPYHN